MTPLRIAATRAAAVLRRLVPPTPAAAWLAPALLAPTLLAPALLTLALAAAPAGAASPAAGMAPAGDIAPLALPIQRVTSPGGIEAWLVEDRRIPVVSLQFWTPGGTTQDPEGKEGAVELMAELLGEGAGDLDARAFKSRLEANGTSLGFDASRDGVSGSLRTLTRARDEAFELLRLALTRPRFDADAVARARSRHAAALRRSADNPSDIARRTWWRLIYPDHAYARRPSGSLAALARIEADDFRALHRDLIARKGLIVGVTGAIDAASLGPLLDQVFGGLPAAPRTDPVPAAQATAGELVVVERDIPQSVVAFGAPGVTRDDPDYEAAHLANYIIGGGGFASRLLRVVREEHGLAYSVSTSLWPMHAGGVIAGSVSTANAEVGRSLDLIRAELARFAAEGPTAAELDDAKAATIGSFPLSLVSTGRIAGYLVAVQRDGLGIDYLERRPERFRRVTLDDVKRVAKRLYDPDRFSFVVVGRPAGVAPTRKVPPDPA